MRYLWLRVLAVGVASVAVQVPAQAQTRTPTVSPYLNLARRDSPPAINYYNLVRPDFAFRAAIGQLQQQVTTNQPNVGELLTATALPPTGHPSGFQTHLRYFQNLGGARASTTTGRAPPTPTQTTQTSRPSTRR